MASLVLVPGAGGMAWYWHRVVPLVRAAGHEPIAIDLPGDDRHAGLAAYADTVVRAIGERSDVILVAQSLAGFTAPLACARATVRMIVFVNAMIPKPGETAGAWWGATGAVEAREQAATRGGYATEFDVGTYFLHDVPQDVLRAGPEQPARKPRSLSASPVGSSAGLTFLFMFLQEETTVFFRSNFNGVSRVKGSERRWRKFPVAISSPCRSRKS
jgi:pimeloyl-ACP methyl ester carboxylesterase